MQRTYCAIAVLAAGFGAPQALSQEIEVTARASAAVSLLDERGAGEDASGAPLLDAGLIVRRTDTFDTGLQLIWRGEVRLQQDAPGRPSFAGDPSACPRSGSACPPPPPAVSRFQLLSPATGLGGLAEDDGLFLAVEGASVALSGGWGEGVLGLDTGAAARLDARAPQVLDSVSVLSPALDPTGRSIVRARNDVSGPSFKGTYLSPRWLGLRVGASYAPEANLRGADFDPRPDAPGFSGAELEQIWEAGVSFDRRFRSTNVRLRTALTAIQAQSGSSGGAFSDYEAWGGGLEIERSGWSAGVRYLSSNNARGDGGGYEALETSLVRETDAWRLGVEYGWARDDLQGLEGKNWMIGARRKFGQHVALGAGWVDSDVEPSVLYGLSRAQAKGLVLEASVRN